MKNFLKQIFFGKGIRKREILFGKAKGISMYLDPAHKVQRIIGTDEREIQGLFVEFAKKCNCLFDVGASDGYYSLLYKKYNPVGEVYLFDADKEFEEVQKKHFDINHINEGINLYGKYVSNINNNENISLDVLQMKMRNILFKIDVEGGEMMVLNGMCETLKKNYCYLIIETHSKQLELDCISFLSKNGYITQIIKNAWWRLFLREWRPLKHNRWLAAYKNN